MIRRFLSTCPQQAVSHNPQITKQLLLSKGEVPNLIYFSQAQFPPGEGVGAHSHTDMFEIFLVESGCGVITIGPEEQELLRGVCVVVEPGEEHALRNTGKETMILTYFALEAEESCPSPFSPG